MLERFAWIIDLQMFWISWERKNLASKYRHTYQSLVEPLIKLYSYIIEYQARAISHLTSPQQSRLWQDLWGSNAWSETKEKINQFDENCRSYVTQEQHDEIRENNAAQLLEIKRLRVAEKGILLYRKENRQDEKERELLRDLVEVAGQYQYTMDRNRERVPGTCEWFLTDEQFLKWLKGNSDLLWVSAGPGRGKSVLSRS
jgi:ankyrin repeat domain-containing protein 50